MSTFFKRLMQVIENKEFKNLNDFALNGLKYDSSSKLNRLKDVNKKPSVDILEDIANKFQDVNLHWLITGTGGMLFEQQNNLSIASEPMPIYNTKDELIEMQREVIVMQREKLAELERKIGKGKEAGKTGS